MHTGSLHCTTRPFCMLGTGPIAVGQSCCVENVLLAATVFLISLAKVGVIAEASTPSAGDGHWYTGIDMHIGLFQLMMVVKTVLHYCLAMLLLHVPPGLRSN